MKTETMQAVIEHGENLLKIFPKAKEKDPVKLCRKLRRLEREGHAAGIRYCNGPDFAEGELDRITANILERVNSLLGNTFRDQFNTGMPCSCRHGQERTNCARCEGTGQIIDFKRFHDGTEWKPVPVFINLDARGYALKIKDEYMLEHGLNLHRDWGGYGIIAPDLTE